MRSRDAISGLFLTLVCVAACVMAYRLGLGSATKPGPGFVPFGIAGLLGLMSLSLCAKGLLRRATHRKKGEGAAELRLKKPLTILLILAGYGACFNTLGFSLSNFLLMMLLVWVVGRQKVTLALTVSIVTTATAYLLFVTAFGLPLPPGLLWNLFGG